MKSLTMPLAALLLLVCAFQASAQDARSYDEGNVTVVSNIVVKDGQWDNYMAYLAGPYKKLMDARIKAGHIVSYGVYAARPHAPGEPNLLLTVNYPNMAAFDGMEDREDALAKEVLGLNPQQGAKASVERTVMRELHGSQMLRQLKLR